jgi:hypothetical protein
LFNHEGRVMLLVDLTKDETAAMYVHEDRKLRGMSDVFET